MQRAFVILSLIFLTLVSCKKATINYPPYRILILGNSITQCDPNSAAGWYGNWGMAASSADKDYVHLLEAKLKALNSGNQLMIKNIAGFEAKFDTYSIADSLSDCRDFNPDLLLLRIGENVNRTNEEALFDQRYRDLIDYFKAKNGKLLVFAAGSAWPSRDMANRVMARHSQFFSLQYLYYDTSNYSFGLFKDVGIQSHPSDKGMKEISSTLYDEVTRMLYPYMYPQ